MARHVVLLRGINIGSRNRVAMAALRDALEEAGFTDVQTYLQSGNVVLESRAKSETVRRKVEQLVEDRFGLEPALIRQIAQTDISRNRRNSGLNPPPRHLVEGKFGQARELRTKG